MPVSLEQFGIDQLPTEDRLELLELIWDSIADERGVPTPIPDWHLRELQQRIAAADADPSAGIPWEEVRARLRESP
jgi:putative addiction module component (TIGR02574 family)